MFSFSSDGRGLRESGLNPAQPDNPIPVILSLLLEDPDLPPGPDSDGDGVVDAIDNCPETADVDQTDTDGDGFGYICDTDDDGDGICDVQTKRPEGCALFLRRLGDNCPLIANPDQWDRDCDGIGTACDDDESVRPPGCYAVRF